MIRTSMRMMFCMIVSSILLLVGCEEESKNNLTVDATNIAFEKEGGTASISVKTNAKSWSIDNPATDWLTLSSTGGTQASSIVSLLVNGKTLEPRQAVLTITADNSDPVLVTVSQLSSDFIYVLSTNVESLSYKRGGGSSKLTINTDAPQWSLSSDANWLEFSKTTGEDGKTDVIVTAQENTGTDSRSTTIKITAEGSPTAEIAVSQIGELYPSYNTTPLAPDATGMSSTAVELAAKISLGLNIGNTLEAIGGETAWGNPQVTNAFIQLVKANGFNAIRIPCSWDQYLENRSTAQIKSSWLDRVKQVVQYCVDNDMYVLLNIHWDGGWLENNCTPEKKEENNAKQKALWEQIATHLRDFDEHLMFASANEPNVDNATQMAVLTSYHQTFVDAVRATGGKNSYRVLVVQGPSTDVEKTNTLMKQLPTDNIPSRMMAEVHYYTPYQYCLMEKDADWGVMAYYWGEGFHSVTDPGRNATWGEESTVDQMMGLMKTQFVDKGIPVILGEYAAARRTTLTGDNLKLHLDSRAYYLKYVTKQAKANGILPFYWDAGSKGNFGSALFDRQNNKVFDQQALDAILEAVME